MPSEAVRKSEKNQRESAVSRPKMSGTVRPAPNVGGGHGQTQGEASDQRALGDPGAQREATGALCRWERSLSRRRRERGEALAATHGGEGEAPRHRTRRCQRCLLGWPRRAKRRSTSRTARAGGDPIAQARRERGVPTFAEAARKVHKQSMPAWRQCLHLSS
jgi:hypothetical protein